MGSMALVEKRPGQQQQQQRRAGGCVGIFFQLLDWNRRLAKKKLFSRKLLPPVGSVKRVSKRFGGDDKMPTSKLKLIADENCGGFPNLKKPDSKQQSFGLSDEDDGSNGMRSAGLVARLMGLETMPVVYQEKPRKALDSELYFDRDESWDCSRLDQDLCTEMGGNGKVDSRPQKIQKTGGFLERQPVNAARFSSDAFRFNKSMLAGSKKQHHKLPTPVKSPRTTLPRRSTVRLMEAATKILDSGSHARNRALTYIGSSRAGGVQGANAGSFSRNSKDSVVGSCRSCGGLVEVPELQLGARGGSMVTECGSSTSDFSNASCSDAGSEEIRMKVHDEVASVVDQVKANAKSRASEYVERKYNIVKVEERSKCREDVVSKPGPKPRNLRQNPLPMAKDKAVSVAKITSRQDGRRYPNEVNVAKSYVSSSKNLNKSTVSRPAKVLAASHKMVVMDRSVGGKQLIRKRRPTRGSQSENLVLVNSKSPQERSAKGVCNNRKPPGVTSDHSNIGRNRIKSELRKRGDGDSSSVGKDNGAFSFTFTAPMRQGSSSSLHKVIGEKSRSGDKHTSELFDSKTVSPDAKNGSLASQRVTTPLRGDALSSLLEQKIKELTSVDMDELAKGDENLGRSTASILEELISALTAGALISQKNVDCCVVDEHSVSSKSCHESTDCYEGDMLQNQTVSINKSLQEEQQPGFAAASPACENDQCSPISILGASFSNESSFSGSPNGSSGCRPETRLTESFNNKVRQLDLDKDLLDSATSIISEKCDSDKSLQSMNKHMKMNKFHPTDSRYVGRPISDIELLLENIFFNESDRTSESSLNKFLLNILESITEAFYVDSEFSSCCSEYEESNTASSFLYDCMMEYMHSKYDGNFYNSGCKAWMRSHLFFGTDRTDRLTTEIYEELRNWQSFSGKNTDDMIAKEMSQSIEKWTKCESNAFDTGIEIQTDILQVLVEEIVVDLCRC